MGKRKKRRREEIEKSYSQNFLLSCVEFFSCKLENALTLNQINNLNS